MTDKQLRNQQRRELLNMLEATLMLGANGVLRDREHRRALARIVKVGKSMGFVVDLPEWGEWTVKRASGEGGGNG